MMLAAGVASMGGASTNGESPAAIMQQVLGAVQRNEFQPILEIVSRADRELASARFGARFRARQMILKLDCERALRKTCGVDDAEFDVFHKMIYPLLEQGFERYPDRVPPKAGHAWREIFVRSEWIRGDVAEVDVAFWSATSAGRQRTFNAPLQRFIMLREGQQWRLAWFGTVAVNARGREAPSACANRTSGGMKHAHRPTWGDFTDLALVTIYGARLDCGFRREAVVRDLTVPKALSKSITDDPGDDRQKMLFWIATGDSAARRVYEELPIRSDEMDAMEFLLRPCHDRAVAATPLSEASASVQWEVLSRHMALTPVLARGFVDRFPDAGETTAAAWRSLAHAYQSTGDHLATAECYEAALRAAPEWEKADGMRDALAREYWEHLGHHSRALEVLRVNERRDPLPSWFVLPVGVKPPVRVAVNLDPTEDSAFQDFAIGPAGDRIAVLKTRWDRFAVPQPPREAVLSVITETGKSGEMLAGRAALPADCRWIEWTRTGIVLLWSSHEATVVRHSGTGTSSTEGFDSPLHGWSMPESSVKYGVASDGAVGTTEIFDDRLWMVRHLSSGINADGYLVHIEWFNPGTLQRLGRINLDRRQPSPDGRGFGLVIGEEVLALLPGEGKVRVLAPDGHTKRIWQELDFVPDGARFRAMASSSDGTIYASLPDDGLITVYGPTGQWKRNFPTEGLRATTLDCDTSGMLWAGTRDIVKVFHPDGRLARSLELKDPRYLGTAGIDMRELIAVKGGGVVVRVKGRVLEYTGRGDILRAWNVPDSSGTIFASEQPIPTSGTQNLVERNARLLAEVNRGREDVRLIRGSGRAVWVLAGKTLYEFAGEDTKVIGELALRHDPALMLSFPPACVIGDGRGGIRGVLTLTHPLVAGRAGCGWFQFDLESLRGSLRPLPPEWSVDERTIAAGGRKGAMWFTGLKRDSGLYPTRVVRMLDAHGELTAELEEPTAKRRGWRPELIGRLSRGQYAVYDAGNRCIDILGQDGKRRRSLAIDPYLLGGGALRLRVDGRDRIYLLISRGVSGQFILRFDDLANP